MTTAMAKLPGKEGRPASGRRLPRASKRSAVPRARGGEARAIADLVPAIGDTAFRKFGFVQSSIITRWPEIVGARLARVTAPDSLRFPRGSRADGVLHISVTSAHAAVVQHVIPDIITRVNRFFGYAAVASVRMKQGRTLPPAAMERTVPETLPNAMAEPPEPRADALHAIQDPELRSVLDALARSLAMRDMSGKLR